MTEKGEQGECGGEQDDEGDDSGVQCMVREM